MFCFRNWLEKKLGKPKMVWEDPVPIGTYGVRRIAQLSNIPFGQESHNVILDFGCGRGRYLEAFAKFNDKNKLIGIERNAEFLKSVVQKGFHGLLWDLETSTIPFKNETIDVVFSSNVLEHIPKPHYYTVIREISRVLKQNGRFIVGIPNYPVKRLYDFFTAFKNPSFFRYYFFDDPTHCNRLSCRELEMDLAPHFHEVCLMPSYLFFERYIKLLKKQTVRTKLKYFGYKITGYAIK